jgi:hypothetical protein
MALCSVDDAGACDGDSESETEASGDSLESCKGC